MPIPKRVKGQTYKACDVCGGQKVVMFRGRATRCRKCKGRGVVPNK